MAARKGPPMLRRCAVLAALLWLGLTSRAGATVSVVLGSSDPDAIYYPGETITLTVHVTANAGEIDNSVNGRITYPDQSIGPDTTVTQNVLPGGSWNASTGTLIDACNPTLHNCFAFSQVTFVLGMGTIPVAINVTDFLLATLTLSIRDTHSW